MEQVIFKTADYKSDDFESLRDEIQKAIDEKRQDYHISIDIDGVAMAMLEEDLDQVFHIEDTTYAIHRAENEESWQDDDCYLAKQEKEANL